MVDNMANVFRAVKDKNYSVISNEYLRDKNLRLESIGLMTIILSLSSDYKITMDSLLKLTKENYRTIKFILKELKENGYVEINKQRDEKGHYYFDYIFFESNKLNPLHTFYKVDKDNNCYIEYNKNSTLPLNTLPPMKNYEDYINTNNI
jgi:DNA-binding transcriptional ArsR family regulator